MKVNDDKFKLSMLISNTFCVIMLFLQIMMLYNISCILCNNTIDNDEVNVVKSSVNKDDEVNFDIKLSSMNLLSNTTEYGLNKLTYETINLTEEISKVKENKKVEKIKSVEEDKQFEKYKEMYGPKEDTISEEIIITTAKVMITDIQYDGMRVDQYTNLYNKNQITTEQMDTIINNWLNGRSSELEGAGQAFIDASNATGYDPIFLLALAANESGWTVSNLHSSKNNPYSIAMVDSNPGGGYTLGDTYYEGIVNGAIWINDNFYKNGNKNLHDMIYSGNYASAKDKWINDILWIMNKSYSMIYE